MKNRCQSEKCPKAVFATCPQVAQSTLKVCVQTVALGGSKGRHDFAAVMLFDTHPGSGLPGNDLASVSGPLHLLREKTL